jgi:hypothetical protein
LAAKLEASRFEAAVASLPRRPSTEKGESASSGNAKVSIFGLLLLFVAKEYLGRVCVPIRGLVGVCDSNLENCSLTFGPKAMNCEVSAEFRGRNCASCPGNRHVSTGLD